MSKFHITKNGTPGKCTAQEGNCPLGGESEHFNTIEEAQQNADKQNEKSSKENSLSKTLAKNWTDNTREQEDVEQALDKLSNYDKARMLNIAQRAVDTHGSGILTQLSPRDGVEVNSKKLPEILSKNWTDSKIEQEDVKTALSKLNNYESARLLNIAQRAVDENGSGILTQSSPKD